jgi:hypothetical protein
MGAGQVESDSFDPEVINGLKEFGLTPEIASTKYANTARGYWAGALIDPVTRRAKGGVSRGLDGAIVGY